MWKFEYQKQTDVPIEQLWAVMEDIENWKEWDNEIKYCELHGQVVAGETFTLKPKNGPKVKVTIEEHTAPTKHIDLTHLPLGKMRFSHLFSANDEGTEIKLKIEIWGVLSFFWSKVIGKELAENIEASTDALIEYTRAKHAE